MNNKENKSTRRLNVRITEKQYKALNKHISWGLRGAVFNVIIDGFIALLDDKGDRVLGEVLAKYITVEDIIKYKK